MTVQALGHAARVGLLTCAALPSGDPDDAHLIAALERAGITPHWVVWRECDSRDLHRVVDLLVIRSPWDYTDHYPQFLEWLNAASVPVLNPVELVRWNTDKRYLLELQAAGVPTIPTVIVETPEDDWEPPPGFEEFVVKPVVGGGSRGVRRFARHQVHEARDHARMLIATVSPAMVQPYLPSVDRGSETALIHFDGVFSHAITKGPMLSRDGERRMVEGLYFEEHIDARQATKLQRAVALAALAAIPPSVSRSAPMYARVDVIDDDEGAPILLELELVEPSLFFGFGASSADVFSTAIAARM